jgi:nucleotide-binding universal stress UspA family protein
MTDTEMGGTVAATGNRIVAGVDGSESSVRALEWAIRQAGLTGAVVDAVCAWQYPVSFGWAIIDDTDYHAQAAAMLDKVIAEARRVDESVTIRAHVLERNAAQALLDMAEGADLLVVGSRGHGGFAGALLGSVSQHCVTHATCPVLVMRGPRH